MDRKYFDRGEEHFRWMRRNVLAAGLSVIFAAVAVGFLSHKNSDGGVKSIYDLDNDGQLNQRELDYADYVASLSRVRPQFEEGVPTQYFANAVLPSPYDLNGDGNLDGCELGYKRDVEELSRKPQFEEGTYSELRR